MISGTYARETWIFCRRSSLTVRNEPMLIAPYTPEEEREVLSYYDLYHSLLARSIEHMREQRGYALLIDGHSMTGVGLGRVHDKGKPRDTFVIGTLGDTSAHQEIIDALVDTIRRESEPYSIDLSVAKNVPYSGGFITRRHSDPDRRVHAIQIEVAMRAYMYEATEEDVSRRYALKQPRVRIIQHILAEAVKIASDAARGIYT